MRWQRRAADAAFPGGNGKIAFSSNRDDPNPSGCGNTCNFEIYTMNPDGTNATRLTNTPAAEHTPAWSADGTKIAYSRTEPNGMTGVWVANADGSGAQNLTAGQEAPGTPPGGVDPAWSPDGSRIAFSKNHYEGVYVMDADGTDPTYLVGANGGGAGRPSWSPDGTKIAYVDLVFFNPQTWTINPDGTDAQLLASVQFIDDHPNWSPDAQRIVFESDRGGVSNPTRLHTMNRDGTDQTSVNEQLGLDAVWSPDATKFAFSDWVGVAPDVLVMNVDGSGLTNLTTNVATDYEADWQPLPTAPGADMVASIDDSPDPVAQGGLLTYTIKVLNPVGPQTATGVQVNLSAGASLYRVSATPSQGTCTLTSCDLGTILVGGTATIEFVVEPTATGTFQGGAAITLDNFDPNTANNVAFEPTTVTPGGYPRPKGATPTRVALVPSFRQCSPGEAGAVHGPPLEHPSCNSPAQTSAHLTVGTPDANSRSANFSAFAKLTALYEPPPLNPNNGDQSDVALEVAATDVRRASDLADYTGELSVEFELRLTDRQNGASLTAPGTVADTSLKFTVPCTATGSTAIGSSCSLQTTAEAVTPALVDEAERAIWQLGRIRVFDGGADGDVDTGGNTLFATQGLFIP